MDHFGVSIDLSDETALISPSGELDLASAPRLRTALARVLRGDHPSLVLDLSRLTFSDCAGLRPVRWAVREGSRVGTDVQLRDALPAVRRVLDLTGLGTTAAVGTQAALA